MNSRPNGYMIIGVDPGLMTGLFVFRTYAANHTEVPQGSVQTPAEQIPNLLHDWIIRANAHMWDDDEGTEEPHGVYLAVEKFVITGRTAKLSQQTDALEVTGMIKAIAALNDHIPVKQYMKANLKFASDAALKRAGWYDPKQPHATDAARQAYALLKDVDYPTWLAVSNGAMMEIDDETKG